MNALIWVELGTGGEGWDILFLKKVPGGNGMKDEGY